MRCIRSRYLPPSRFPIWLIMTALACPALASAQQTSFETEPNDTPAQSNPISAPTILFGSMPPGDQDGFLLTIADNDARVLWNFELTGIPGALTIADLLRVEYADNGVDVRSVEPLMKMGTRDGVTPSIHRNQLLEPGDYILGIAHTGGPEPDGNAMFRPPVASIGFNDATGAESPRAASRPDSPAAASRAYRFVIEAGDPIDVSPSAADHSTQDGAMDLRPGLQFAAFDRNPAAWYRVTFDETAASQRWNLEVRAPIGRQITARLRDSAGAELDQRTADAHGQILFTDLAPEPTTWFVELTTPEPGFIHSIATHPVGERVDGAEAEPNDQFPLANRVDLARTLTGRIDVSDGDSFRFTPGEELAEQVSTLRIESVPPINLRMCLTTSSGVAARCRDGTTPLELPDLVLGTEEWGLVLGYAPSAADYSITLTAQGPIESEREAEPNDEIEFANTVPSNLRIRGRFSGDDADFYQFIVPGEAQLWRFQLVGEEIFELGYLNGANGSGQQSTVMRAQPGQRRVRLDDMFLLPGRHFIRISGRDGGEYTLLARAMGPPDPNGELEPNDVSNRQRLAIGQTRTGLLADPVDTDHYRFFLANTDHIRLTITPPPDGAIQAMLHWYGQDMGRKQGSGPGEPLVLEGVFPPGDYQLVLLPQQASDAEYRLSLERLPRFSCPTDCEPNGMGEIHLAAPLPTSLVLEGRTGDWDDEDHYQLPRVDAPTELLIRAAQPLSGVYLGTSSRARELLQYDGELGGYRATLRVGEDLRLMLSGNESYRLELQYPDASIQSVDGTMPMAMEFTFEQDTVAAYRTYGQRIAGDLVLRNSDTSNLPAQLEVLTSDHRWRVEYPQTEVDVPGGGHTAIPITIHIPADAWANRPVRISARARDRAGRHVEAWTEIAVASDAATVDPELHWPLPDALLGGFDAAWRPFGGTVSVDRSESGPPDSLHDGLSLPGIAFLCCTDADGWAEDERPEWTLDLPGDRAMPIAGIAINHFGPAEAYQNIRTATLQLSNDGANFEDALHFETLPIKTEQYFALPEPSEARFARLRIENTFQEGPQRIYAGEWKVILQPGHDLSGGNGFNIADPAFGGHVVWDAPSEAYNPTGILVDEDHAESAGAALRSATKDYVIGFHQGRAAQITAIEWRYAPATDDTHKAYRRVSVAASRESPVGPWTPLGDMDLSGGQLTATLDLPAHKWARYVRLRAEKGNSTRSPMEPGLIRIWERPTADDYRSILTEWGELEARSFYEQQQGLPRESDIKGTSNTSRAAALPLVSGKAASGEVTLRDGRTHWYGMTVPTEHNTLTVVMSGDPTVRTVVHIENEDNENIPLRRIEADSLPGRHVFEAVVEAGSEIRFKVFEPPRNVVFSWDTSASVAPYIPLINSALVAFSGQVVPGQESVNLMPFSMYPLLKRWSGEPYALQTMLNEQRPGTGSSSAEWTLMMAGRELAPRPGTKAIVVITDAATPHDADMWDVMKDVQPRIFDIGVAGETIDDQHRLRDWAAINGGHFSRLVYEGEMEVAFDRAIAMMQRPAAYTLSARSEFRELPGPGRLSVMSSGSGSAAGGAAVELILDASGSMLKRMQGQRRIDIAKTVVSNAVRELIPDGTPVALRVFGHREPGACRTDLEIPLGPLDAGATVAAIDGITAMNLARTPIADSLAAVEADLNGAPDGAVVVLVTDGEETCDGNPEAVLTALRERGVAVSLNIVGFAIEDAKLAAQFEAWARLGGGRYFAADDPGGLSQAIKVALRIPFTVYDKGGNEVAIGQVGGDPVELAQGVYRVVVSTSEPRSFGDVEVVGDGDVTLEY